MYHRPLDTPVSRVMEGGENETFEAVFENGVMSMARPGQGVKFGVRVWVDCLQRRER